MKCSVFCVCLALMACTTDFETATYCANNSSDPRCAKLIVHDTQSVDGRVGNDTDVPDTDDSNEDVHVTLDIPDTHTPDTPDAIEEVPDTVDVADTDDGDVDDGDVEDVIDTDDIADTDVPDTGETSDADTQDVEDVLDVGDEDVDDGDAPDTEEINEIVDVDDADTPDTPDTPDTQDVEDVDDVPETSDEDTQEPQCIINAQCLSLDDGNLCNGIYVCLEGACVFDASEPECKPSDACVTSACDPETGLCTESAIMCDDEVTCTTDTCDPSSGCVFKPDDSVCDEGEACTTYVCEPDGCAAHATDDPCDDGDVCTQADMCQNFACAGKPIPCNDDDQCTEDVCMNGLCFHFASEDGPCDDGDPCTENDTCVDLVCAGSPVSCSDDNVCTNDVCIAGVCAFLPNADACDDGDACTQNDACLGGTCSGEPFCQCNTDEDCGTFEDDDLCNGTLTCDTSALPWTCVVDEATIIECADADESDCTVYACDPVTANCEPYNAPDNNGCDDGSACTQTDVCSAGMCAGSPVACDDGSICTDDACDPEAGCTYTPTEPKPCDDGDEETITDTCLAGACDGVLPYVENFDGGTWDGWVVEGSVPDDHIQVLVPSVGWSNAPEDLYLAVRVMDSFTLSTPTVMHLHSPVLDTPHSPLPVIQFTRWVGSPCTLTYVEFVGSDGVVQDSHCGSESKALSKIDLDSNKPTNVVTLRVTLLPGSYAGESDLFRFDYFVVRDKFKP